MITFNKTKVLLNGNKASRYFNIIDAYKYSQSFCQLRSGLLFVNKGRKSVGTLFGFL